MDVDHAVLFAKKIDVSMVTADCLSAKSEQVMNINELDTVLQLLQSLECIRNMKELIFMKIEVASNFNGILNIKDQKNVHQAFFHIDKDLVTVIPCSRESQKAIYASTDSDAPPKDEKDMWLYGVAEDGCSVAFYHPNDFSVRISAPINLGTAQFHAPILLKSTSPIEMDLSSFDAIEFCGGILDILHMTGKIVDECYSEKTIKFRSQDFFTKTFPVGVDGADFEITYTISTHDFSVDTGKVPDLRHGIHSVLRFDFSEEQSIQKFRTYYNYALNFLQFCAGRLNVGFEVRLYKKNVKGGLDTIMTRIRDGFDDYAENSLNITQVIQFDLLNEKFPKLFKLINEDATRPYLQFLTKRNKHIGYILYTDVPAICVALEREYEFSKNELMKGMKTEGKELAKELTKVIENSNHSDQVKNKAINLVKGSLPNLQPSLKEKINALLAEFFLPMKSISEPLMHVEYGITKSYTIDEMKSMISKFVEMRHRASHAGIVWNEGKEVFPHLHLLVYFNVLKRSGYAIEESKCILSYMFGRKF